MQKPKKVTSKVKAKSDPIKLEEQSLNEGDEGEASQGCVQEAPERTVRLD